MLPAVADEAQIRKALEDRRRAGFVILGSGDAQTLPVILPAGSAGFWVCTDKVVGQNGTNADVDVVSSPA